MKRAWTKKVKADPTCAAGNDALEEHFKPVQPKVKRRVRTSAVMIGLVISMGAPNLLLTRQSDSAPAAEPVGNEPTVSKIPAAAEANLSGNINSVQPEAAKSVPAAASSSAPMPPTPRVRLKAAAVSTPAPPVVEYKLQKQQKLRQLSQEYHVERAASATPTVGITPSNSLTKHPELESEKVLKIRRVNRLVQRLKASKTVPTQSRSYRVNRSKITPAVETTASQQRLVQESRRVTDDVNGTLTTKQKILINRLKQKPNRLKDSLAQLRSEESNNQTPAKESVEHSYVIEKAQSSNQGSLTPPSVKATVGQQPDLRQRLRQTLAQSAVVVVPAVPSSQEQSSNQASITSPVVKGTVEQQPVHSSAPQVTLDENAVFDLEKSQATPQASVVVPTVPNSQEQSSNQASLTPLVVETSVGQQPDDSSAQEAVVVPDVPNAVNEPTGVVASVSPDYQVRPGDTLSAIARHHGILLSELVHANQLSDPNLLEINQQIRIPSFQRSSAVGKGASVGPQQAARSPQVATSLDTVLNAQQLQQTKEGAVVIPDVPMSAVNKRTVVVASSLDYQVKPGDTLSAIARHHGISLPELVKSNQLTDPNLLQINQRITIPNSQYSSAVAQTIAAIKRPTYSVTTVSTMAVPTPPERLAGTPSLNAAYSGMGGSISDETDELSPPTFEQTQLAQPTATSSGMGGSISNETDELSSPTFNEAQLAQSQQVKAEPQSNPYVQELRSDIQRLRQKYYSASALTTAPIRSEAINPQVRPNLPANQPINPEFRVAQAAENLQPVVRKQIPNRAPSAVPPRAKGRVATAPAGVDASESVESLRGRQVSPELPPLGAVDTYLPKPSSAPFKGFIWPAKGVLTSRYGWRWGRMHKGIDVAAPIGTPIVAAAPGVVVRAGWNSGGYGKLVDIRHADGSLTRYAHNNRILVHAGQEVDQGQQISEMGSTGFSTGPHLHFEVHATGKGAVNPIAFLPNRGK